MSSLQRKNGQLRLELQRAVGDRQEALREMERDKTSLISLDSKHKNDLLKFERDNEVGPTLLQSGLCVFRQIII